MNEVLEDLACRLYCGIHLRDGKIMITDEEQVARAYLMALNIKEYGCVDYNLLEFQVGRFNRERQNNFEK